MSAYDTPPQPVPDVDSAPFWAATADGRLELCRCTACRQWLQPPLERCRRCAVTTAFEPIAGTGVVHSYIVVRQPMVPGYLDDLPHVVALVELDEQCGLRLPTRLVETQPEDVHIGMRVRIELRPLPGGSFVVPLFRPA